MRKGSLYIISGPSGSGKDTVMKKVFEKLPDLRFSISCITRPMREGEKQGEKYNFISKPEFEKMIKEDLLLEYNEFVGNYYGTPLKPVEACVKNGEDMMIEVDVNGAANIRKKLPYAISIFIMPPSLETLESRLRNRATDSEEAIASRLVIAKEEMKRAGEFDYTVINDDLETAVESIVNIINKNKQN